MELGIMEQQCQAVLAVVQGGWRVVEVAHRLGVSHQSMPAWTGATQGGFAALAGRSHRPATCPH